MVKFIEQFTPLKQRDLVGAATSSSIEILQYYLDKGFSLGKDLICTGFQRSGLHKEFLRFAVRQGAKMTTEFMNLLVGFIRDLDLVREMRSLGCKLIGMTF